MCPFLSADVWAMTCRPSIIASIQWNYFKWCIHVFSATRTLLSPGWFGWFFFFFGTSHMMPTWHLLAGGFKYFLFSTLLGEIIQFAWYFSNGLKPPTSLPLIGRCNGTIHHEDPLVANRGIDKFLDWIRSSLIGTVLGIRSVLWIIWMRMHPILWSSWVNAWWFGVPTRRVEMFFFFFSDAIVMESMWGQFGLGKWQN